MAKQQIFQSAVLEKIMRMRVIETECFTQRAPKRDRKPAVTGMIVE